MPMMQTATYSRRQDDDVYLFPGENALKQVIGPARPADAAFEEMLIPDVECWFPGDLPLDLVHEVLTVRVTDRRPKKGPAELLAEFASISSALRTRTYSKTESTNAATRIHATDCRNGSPTLNWN
jgi:hypothetical protein